MPLPLELGGTLLLLLLELQHHCLHLLHVLLLLLLELQEQGGLGHRWRGAEGSANISEEARTIGVF